MILGTGADIIEVQRIQAACERHGDRFVKRVLRPSEIAYCESFSVPWPHIAARFAAKEAVSKAFGTGIGAELGWQDIEVANLPSGQPYVTLHDRGRVLMDHRGGGNLHLTLSHTQNYALAVAVLETD
ncbi:MAG: holo-ACP synthase [Verrucomicrobiae bacterium]|nr:holo-ACP synthase [Verrucomicrobiae bacterium]MCP5520573.1 holo-ACP synthase [Verrucomicrobiales bacterium]